MVDSINFVREQRRRLGKQQQADLKIFKYAVMVVAVGFVALLLSVAIQLFLNWTVQNTMAQQQSQLNIINAQAENERSYVTFATKLQALSELFTDRRNKQEAIAYFSTLFDPTVLINGISYRGDENQLTFTVESPNIFSLNRVVEILNSQEVQDRFESVAYENLTRGENGEYEVRVIVRLNSETG